MVIIKFNCDECKKEDILIEDLNQVVLQIIKKQSKDQPPQQPETFIKQLCSECLGKVKEKIITQ